MADICKSYTHIASQLPTQPLKYFVSTLLSRLPEESTPQVIVVKPELPAPTPVRPNGQKARSAAAAYDAGVLFVLELATILAARDEATIAELGKEVADALQSVVRNAAHAHPITFSRAIYYLLSFLRASHVSLNAAVWRTVLMLCRSMTLSVRQLFCTPYLNSTKTFSSSLPSSF